MQIIDGKLVAATTRAQIAQEVAAMRAGGLKREIGLAVIFVGNNPASEVYVRNKIKACEEVGLKSYLTSPLYSLRPKRTWTDALQRKRVCFGRDVTAL